MFIFRCSELMPLGSTNTMRCSKFVKYKFAAIYNYRRFRARDFVVIIWSQAVKYQLSYQLVTVVN